ncbi:MAG: polyprenyl synthetase family protein [Candidatus Sericytochromatia bacterium]
MHNNLMSFFSNIKNKVLLSLENHNFESTQLSLLKESFNAYQRKSEADLFTTTLFLFYFVSKSLKKELNEQAQLLGSFCTLYILSLDLFDDVQDDDLKGKPYESVGVPIAVNNAITLLFLSLEFLTKAIELETNVSKKHLYLKIFNEASITAVKGQHKDLMGYRAVSSTQDVLNMQKEKASSVSLITKCAAIFSDCDDVLIEKFNSVSQKITLVFQIVDDIRDIFGKKMSPDLLTNKITYPISCFLELANENEINHFNQLKKDLPNSIKKIREVLYDSGAVKKVSETIESLRVHINKELLSLNIDSPNIRTMIYMVDAFASSIYKTPILEESKSILQPDREWDKYVKNILNEFFNNMKEYNPPPKIEIFPWHLPQWMYEPKRNIIFYSDIEEQSEEIIPIHSNIMGINDYEFVKEIVISSSHLVMAHELFHYWRNFSNKLTKDYWYEEYVSNSLAISYLMSFFPNLYNEALILVDKILDNTNIKLKKESEDILNRLFSDNLTPIINNVGYGVDNEQMSLIHFFMLDKIFKEKTSLEKNIKRFL